MPSVRPAVRCRATNRAGQTCGNFAMLGGRVCHAHGGRAPQVRSAARRRRDMALAYGMLAREIAEREDRRRALAPWAGRIRAEGVVSTLVPEESAHRYRTWAREMTAVARLLRAEAQRLIEDEH